MNFNIHGTITENNLQQKYQETKLYGPLRLKLSRFVVQAMNQLGWTWSLDGGDLLGAWRNGKMLPHDDDFDFWVYTEEITFEDSHQTIVSFENKMRDTIQNKLNQILQKECEKHNKEKLPKEMKVRTVSSYAYKLQVYQEQYNKYNFREFDYHNVTCDLTFMAPLRKNQKQGQEKLRLLHEHNKKFNMNVDKKHILPIKVNGIIFEGYEYNCPASIEKYLESNYGYLGLESFYNPVSGYYEKRPAENTPKQQKQCTQ